MAGRAVVTIKGKQWTVDVANTPAELISGLGGVASIPPNTGMLFDLGSDQSFIDINTTPMLFKMDVVFIGSSTGVRGCCRNVIPGELCCFEATITPGARYFLEVNAGEAGEIETGDSVDIRGVIGAVQPAAWWVVPLIVGGMIAASAIQASSRAIER